MPLTIAIVGAGIGGTAAGIALVRQGHKVTIYERATTTTDVGFALRITPNSDRCLKYFGIDTEAGGAVAANSMKLFDAISGDLLFEHRENKDENAAKGATSVFAFRPQLAKQLTDTALALGVDIQTGAKVVAVDTKATQLTLERGQRIAADLIVGCDGLHSVVRPYIFDVGIYFPKATSGSNCIRFMLSASDIKNDPYLSRLINNECRMVSWKLASAEQRILVYPVNFSEQWNITCIYPQGLTDKTSGGIEEEKDESKKVAYDQRMARSTALELYADWEPCARRVIELGDPDGFRYWNLKDLDDPPRWHVNKTLLIGDAAHAVLPFGYSGASMAIEDGVILGELFPGDVTADQIPERLRLFERVRRPRVNKVRETSRLIARDQKGFMKGYFEFLADYDAPQDGQRALEEALSSSS